MKKITLTLFVFCTLLVGAQTTTDITKNNSDLKVNELKINTFNLIAFEQIDLSYERLLNEESSIGLSVLFSFDDDNYGINDARREFSLTPFYRQFFGKKYAKGFFVEAFAMLHSGEDEAYLGLDDFTFQDIVSSEKFTDFALGISAGGKFVTKRGFAAEVYLGIGRNLLNNSPYEVVGRGGISLGYRF